MCNCGTQEKSFINCRGFKEHSVKILQLIRIIMKRWSSIMLIRCSAFIRPIVFSVWANYLPQTLSHGYVYRLDLYMYIYLYAHVYKASLSTV